MLLSPRLYKIYCTSFVLILSICTFSLGEEPKDPESAAQAFLAEGRNHAQSARYTEAIASFKAALELTPQLTDAHTGIGLISLRLGQFDTARVSLEKAMSLSPNSPKIIMGMGKLLMALGDYASARDHFRVVLDACPHCDGIHQFVGSSYLFEGDLKAGEKYFRREMEIAQDPTPASSRLILVLVVQGRLEEARSLLSGLRNSYPGSLHLKWGEGLISLMDGKIDRASTLFEEVKQVSGAEFNRLLLGLAYLLLDRLDDAEKEFLDLIEGRGISYLMPSSVRVSLARIGMVFISLYREEPDASARSLQDIEGLIIGGQAAWKILAGVTEKMPGDKREFFLARLKKVVGLLPESEMRKGLSMKVERTPAERR